MTTWNLFSFDPGLDPERLAADCAAWGFDRVILPPEHFANPGLLPALRRRGVKVWLNLPVLYAPADLPAHPEHYAVTWRGERAIHGWLHMACPTDEAFLEARAAAFAAILPQVEPVEASLDFLRCFVFWEQVARDADPAAVIDGCYCPRCLAAFGRFAGEPARRDAAGRILPEQWRAWAGWKVARITALAARFAALVRTAVPGVPLHAKTIPWSPGELGDGLRRIAGQDLEALAPLFDRLIPMTFTHLLDRDPAWKAAHLAEVVRRTGKEVFSYVEVESIRGGTIPLAQVSAEIEVALAERRDVVVFHHGLLAADPGRRDLVASAIRAHRERR